MRNQANCSNSCVVLAIIIKFNQKLLFHFLSLQATRAVSMHVPFHTLFHVQVHEILASISMAFLSPVAPHSLRSKTVLPLLLTTFPSSAFLLPLFPQKSLLQPLPVLPSFVPLSSRRVRVSLFDSDCALTPKRRETQKELERVPDAVLFFFSAGRVTAPFFFSLSFFFIFLCCVRFIIKCTCCARERGLLCTWYSKTNDITGGTQQRLRRAGSQKRGG